ncbi:uncharacterized protein BXZ73DRAFT_98142 [Epithele typhae]|uniref:uncharacterized protein n=1 Tax=Epithele typhae TaxID=378194 RepID=UPI0020089EB7|nr:uncharacterized protein BXZ73DRAFT_98142 [Epithele typhae]KAH9941752.1 hypothetical protein BXZ73DRAFT_98142 [Epithele typhae]
MPLIRKHRKLPKERKAAREEHLNEHNDHNHHQPPPMVGQQQQPYAGYQDQQHDGPQQDQFSQQPRHGAGMAGIGSGGMMDYSSQQQPGMGPQSIMQQGGSGSGVGGAGPNPNVPPVTHINAGVPGNAPSKSGQLTGKAERAVGSLVGSQALKERGFMKEQEAGAFKMQSAEIAEAERLEKEALMRRERAVAHGAHPDNRHLGGMQNASTLDDVTQDPQRF